MAAEFFIHRLSNGKTVQVDGAGSILMELDEEGRVNSGILSTQDRRELKEIHAQAAYETAHETAAGRQFNDPRFGDVRAEILRRYRPAEVQIIDADPHVFNGIFEELREEVGKSILEHDEEIARVDEAAEIVGRLNRQAESKFPQTQDMGDIARLLNIKEKEGE